MIISSRAPTPRDNQDLQEKLQRLFECYTN